MTNPSPKKASPEDWHPADILAALHKRGITLRGLARSHGLSNSSTLSAAMIRSYPKSEQRLADALGVHPKEIWPSRYFPDGDRKPQGLRALKNGSALAARRNVKVGTGA